ncbi:5'-3' exoribonuclease 3-like [Silene latifolia]|uniref:5'-3' exoribonuclease 3-like n=1 Tax=Silene latifolia TaxID=37657 RepID=UPI003D76D69A
MGVKGFYRWLVNKYPNIVSRVKVDSESTELEFCNFYLDMTEIIHSCFHPDTFIFPPTTFEEVFENIYKYIDRLLSLVRPRNLLYLAIDGVGPRAKQNQQRGRIYWTAKENDMAEEEEKKLRKKYESKGKKLLPVFESQVSDSNVIAPGTEFMFELSNVLKSYIAKKLKTDPAWQQLQVILSDATVPGEGEHKIVSFIHTLRSLPGYDPNTRHCVYGRDSDLITLALATHEIHFSLLKEVLQGPDNVEDQKPVLESALLTIFQRDLDKLTEHHKKPFNIRDYCPSTLILPQHYEFLHVWILREYLELDMQIIDPPHNFVIDCERIIDDFIFMCLLMGNDFLPPLPTLVIDENGIGLLMHVYKNEFKNFGGYLVDMQQVDELDASFIELKRVETFILLVGSYEEKIFKKRIMVRETKHRKIISTLVQSKDDLDEQSSEVCDVQSPEVGTCVGQIEATESQNFLISDIMEMIENTKELKDEVRKSISENADVYRDGDLLLSDKVKLGSAGWRQRYYKEKFSVEDPEETEILRKEIVQKYTEGLCWIMMYYFSEVPSWNWYYPYHYGLFASEFEGLAQVKVKFHTGSPLKPFDQLMAVLPPTSAHVLPEAYRDLMISSDSRIIEFYSRDVEVDADGKRYLWQGIFKLPFIDQEKLLDATCQLEAKVEMHEAKRNVETTDLLFWRGSNSCTEVILDYIVQHTERREEFQPVVHEEPIMYCNLKLPVESLRTPRLLEGVLLPEKTVSEKEISETPLWHAHISKIHYYKQNVCLSSAAKMPSGSKNPSWRSSSYESPMSRPPNVGNYNSSQGLGLEKRQLFIVIWYGQSDQLYKFRRYGRYIVNTPPQDGRRREKSNLVS